MALGSVGWRPTRAEVVWGSGWVTPSRPCTPGSWAALTLGPLTLWPLVFLQVTSRCFLCAGISVGTHWPSSARTTSACVSWRRRKGRTQPSGSWAATRRTCARVATGGGSRLGTAAAGKERASRGSCPLWLSTGGDLLPIPQQGILVNMYGMTSFCYLNIC